MWDKFKTLDPWLFLIPLILLPISVVVIYALTVDAVGTGLYLRQASFAVLGIVLMLVVTFLDYRIWKSGIVWLYILGVISLIAVKLFGSTEFGAQRWLDLGFIRLQPGELSKLIGILTVASFFSHSTLQVTAKQFAAAAFATIIPVLLVLIEPDLGTSLVVLFSSLIVALHAKLQKVQRYLILGGLSFGLLFMIVSYYKVPPFGGLLQDYQRERITAFVNPSHDQSRSGYNVMQSVIAVGSGGLTGRGLGFGSQSQLNFLPVVHADFIFAGIAEAWGLVGSLSILSLYAILLLRIVQAARIAKDQFGMLLCIGIAGKILIEVVVNIGMNMRLMPVTGIPLPLLSFGGTTMIVNMLAIGLVQSVVIRYKRLTF